MRASRPIKVSFSFYPTDTAVLAKRVAELKQAGVKVRQATVLRALIHITEPSEMVAGRKLDLQGVGPGGVCRGWPKG